MRTTQSAFALAWDTVTSPFLTVTNQRALVLPFESSIRNVPVAFSSSGSWPRASRSSKNSVVASVMGPWLSVAQWKRRAVGDASPLPHESHRLDDAPTDAPGVDRERTEAVTQVARLGHRAARDHRPADRPDRSRRRPRGRIPPGAAVLARLRLLGRADGGRLGPRPHRARLGRADAPPRLQ